MKDHIHGQEFYRAQAVVEKARRLGQNVGDALREHMVSPSIAQEVFDGSIDYVAKQKKRGKSGKVLEDWVKHNVGRVVSPADVAKETNLSYATANKFFGSRRDLFEKVSRGQYSVKDGWAERAASKGAV